MNMNQVFTPNQITHLQNFGTSIQEIGTEYWWAGPAALAALGLKSWLKKKFMAAPLPEDLSVGEKLAEITAERDDLRTKNFQLREEQVQNPPKEKTLTPQERLLQLLNNALNCDVTFWSFTKNKSPNDPSKCSEHERISIGRDILSDLVNSVKTELCCYKPGLDKVTLYVSANSKFTQIKSAVIKIGDEDVSHLFSDMDADGKFIVRAGKLAEKKFKAVMDARLNALADDTNVHEAVFKANFSAIKPEALKKEAVADDKKGSKDWVAISTADDKKCHKEAQSFSLTLVDQAIAKDVYDTVKSLLFAGRGRFIGPVNQDVNKMTDNAGVSFQVMGPDRAEFWIQGVSCMPFLTEDQQREIGAMCYGLASLHANRGTLVSAALASVKKS